jgi:alpha-tubulin suppressor-like RCC1 family protein
MKVKPLAGSVMILMLVTALSACGGGQNAPPFTPNSIPKTLALSAWGWGDNEFGQLGNGTTVNNLVPLKIEGLSDVVAISGGEYHSLALTSDGSVWAWGDNEFGQLGNGTTQDSTVPVKVSNLSDVTGIAAGQYHSLAVKSDGTVWAWGHNNYGQLGDKTTNDRYTPVQVIGLSKMTAVAAGFEYSVSLNYRGILWAWGFNDFGQLGDGSNVDRHTPVQVNLDPSDDTVTAFACGYYQTIAVIKNNSVRVWGANTSFDFGGGAWINSNSPIPISGLSGVKAVAGGYYHMAFLKSDGTVWMVGQNGYGQLGNGTITDSFTMTPVQVSSLSGVSAIATGAYHTIALRQDGTVYTWGWNQYGQLGDNSTSISSVPVEVLDSGGINYLNGVIAIAGGAYHSIALTNP